MFWISSQICWKVSVLFETVRRCSTIGSPCNADQLTRNSIEQAVMKAAPLPYQGYEKDFQRNLTLNFKYDG